MGESVLGVEGYRLCLYVGSAGRGRRETMVSGNWRARQRADEGHEAGK